MAKQTPFERYMGKVEALCLETGVSLPTEEQIDNVQAWRDVHAKCRRQQVKSKAQDSANLTDDREYRRAKRSVLRANTQDRLTVQTEMAEEMVLARLQRERIETELRERLGMTKDKSSDGAPVVDDAGEQTADVQTLPA